MQQFAGAGCRVAGSSTIAGQIGQLRTSVHHSYAPLDERVDPGLMARRLPGGEAFHYRRSDHSAEIADLRTQVGDGTVLEALTRAVAADLLQAHDETGISLDDWLSARLLVELLIGKPILENEA